MELLSASRREGLRLIREQLCCMLCERIFEDPQCLDCKHNFCRECIYVHLRKNESKCPTCQIPIFPSEITRNQFLESILVAWKVVEKELSFLAANSVELGITAADTDRALGSFAANQSPEPPSNAHANAAATSSGAAIAAALVGTTPSRGPVGNRKWNINTTAIRNEQKEPKQRTGVAASSPMRTSSQTYVNGGGGNDDTPGATQMTQMPSLASPGARVPSRRRSIFPSASQTSLDAYDEHSSNSSSSVRLMPTQEVESILERIQQQNRALSEWEQSRWRSQTTSQKTQQRRSSPAKSAARPASAAAGSGISAMERLMKNWVATGSSQSATRHDDDDDDDNDDDDDDETQTQMPLNGYADSPDLLLANGVAPTRMNGLGLEAASKRSTTDTPKSRRRPSKSVTAMTENGVKPSPRRRTNTLAAATLSRRPAPSATSAPQQPNGKAKRAANDSAADGHADEPTDARRRKWQRVVDNTDVSALVVPTTRPPLASANRARQLAAAIRESSTFTLVATDLDSAECKRVSTACALLGGRFGLQFDLRPDPVTGKLCSSVTHLVAKAVAPGARRCKRTAKYMRALAEGCYVMDYAWVDASLDAGRWLREDAFEMLGDAYSTSVGKPHESRVRRQQTGERHALFATFRFVLLCDAREFDYQVDTLQGVVVNFGASIISASQFVGLSAERRSQKTHVGLVGRTTAPADAKCKWDTYQIPIVRVAWLFECISHLQVLPYEDFYPYF